MSKKQPDLTSQAKEEWARYIEAMRRVGLPVCASMGIYAGPYPNAEPPAGRKDDAQKDPWQLLPWDALRGIVRVLAFGANKYDARNWEKGMEWDRVWRAAIEHLTEWFQHGKPDPETGYSHLWHAGCCVLFLIAYELRGIGTDNRPGKSTKGE